MWAAGAWLDKVAPAREAGRARKRARRPALQGQPEEASQPYPLGWWIVKAFEGVVFTGRVVRAKLPEEKLPPLYQCGE